MNFQDLGPNDNSSVDYPDYAHKVAKKVKLDKNKLPLDKDLIEASQKHIVLKFTLKT